MAIVEEPITLRLDRLNNMLRHLEEIRGCNRSSPKSSCASIESSGTQTSDGNASSMDLSAKSLEKKSRPMEHVIIETEVKGTLIERLEVVEDRVLKLCLQLEEELEAEKNEKKAHMNKKGLKQLALKLCRKGSSRNHV
ncbi:hypothetical protein I3760_14G002200 [Carya illinoinensis]|uniref:Uncharacterized protein n=1 Tax=Carya illinoinensis TaxID=32201 RepID=A0A922A8P0_CARIL|nr:hypothetical protein I3760_14G002200 [Carya illinoinensis]KAG6676912.1 hypothetical protein I3842_14G002200 [Carya illinoinensis]